MPVSEPVKKPKATWVEPALEAEVAYSTMAENGLLRESRVQGRWNPLMPLAFNTG
jgi:bifunctional non-homologous end joining protein LigD